MHDDTTTTPNDAGHEPEREADLLISRMIDGEASEHDRERFERLATAEPSLWRTFALRQQDMSTLAEEVHAATRAAAAVELGSGWGSGRLLPAGLTWTLAASGWAAVLIVATWWGLVATTGAGLDRTPITPAIAPPRLTPEDHYRRYLAAPYVLGDMEPVVLEVESLSDGRIALHFVRRIEEVAFLDPDAELPVDEAGELTKDPRALRQREPVVTFPN